MRVVPDHPAPRPSLEDLRGLSGDLDLLVAAVRDLVALQAEIDAGLRRYGAGPTPADGRGRPPGDGGRRPAPVREPGAVA